MDDGDNDNDKEREKEKEKEKEEEEEEKEDGESAAAFTLSIWPVTAYGESNYRWHSCAITTTIATATDFLAAVAAVEIN